MNLKADINIFLLFVSLNLSARYRSTLIITNVITNRRKGNRNIFQVTHKGGSVYGLNHRKSSAGNSVLWFQFQHYRNKVDLICL